MNYATKTFFGTTSFGGISADIEFNKWIQEHPNIEILEFRYQQARYGDHSICILYKEN